MVYSVLMFCPLPKYLRQSPSPSTSPTNLTRHEDSPISTGVACPKNGTLKNETTLYTRISPAVMMSKDL